MNCDNCDNKIKRKDFFYEITKNRSWIGKIITSTVNYKYLCGLCYYNLIDGKQEGRIKDKAPTSNDLYSSLLTSIVFSLLSIKTSIDIFTGSITFSGILLFFALIFFIDTIINYKKLSTVENV